MWERGLTGVDGFLVRNPANLNPGSEVIGISNSELFPR